MQPSGVSFLGWKEQHLLLFLPVGGDTDIAAFTVTFSCALWCSRISRRTEYCMFVSELMCMTSR